MDCNKIIQYCESYIQQQKQLIIIISGLSGTNKIHIGQFISQQLNIKYLNHLPYINKNKNINTDEYINWEKFNKKINKLKTTGVIITTSVFPTDLINFKTDIHINLFISKTSLKKNKEKHDPNSKIKQTINNSLSNTISLKTKISDNTNEDVNKLYSYYINSSKRSKFNIVYDIDKLTNINNVILNYICNFLYQEYKLITNDESNEDISEEINEQYLKSLQNKQYTEYIEENIWDNYNTSYIFSDYGTVVLKY